ncbi:MAG: threonine--tRNA ligase [Thaumarchaeota archaeon]|nr:threonine--tRNA ligase [Candidatus Calditenuaceae archaeon]MDW8187055.1 threonine--tRNA ligase [Nitrososphaerota archaeon]
MRALQLHVDSIEYEPVAVEGPVHEEAKREVKRHENLLVLFTTVERDDSEEVAKEMVRQVKESMERLGVRKLLVYPYAHLSSDLAQPRRALELIRVMAEYAEELGIGVSRAPFGWTKRFSVAVKGHPLAEQFRVVTRNSVTARTETTTVRKPETSRQVALLEEVRQAEPVHISLGRELDVFSVNEHVGPGLILFHPRGAVIREELIRLIREVNLRLGFQEVWTPHLFRSTLWYKTGHYETFRDRMFHFKLGDDEYVLKPMNCPGHAMIYASKSRSYRELPVKLSEFGTVYRNEQAGELTGLLRVRSITQDDGHVFARPDQVESVVREILEVSFEVLEQTLGARLQVNLSTRPDKFIGTPEIWELAESDLKAALDSLSVSYQVKEGEGAFYGPKIDVDVEDSLGRRWQCTTVQLDFFMPERLGLEYVDQDNAKKRPVMIHRAILGSLERFIGILIEHYNGRLPVWLSPIQVVVLPVTAGDADYASKVSQVFAGDGIRTEVWHEGTLEKRIREAHRLRASFVAIVGKRESVEGTVSVRDHRGKVMRGVKVEDAARMIGSMIRSRERNVGVLRAGPGEGLLNDV